METYTIGCPICGLPKDIELKDVDVIYYIEAYESDKRKLGSLFRNKPDSILGQKLMIDKNWVKVEDLNCDEGHKIQCYISHYQHTERSERVKGPADQPTVRCPHCKTKLDDHEDHIIRMDSDLDMQYVLRNVSRTPTPTYTHVDAITSKNASKYNQMSVTRKCYNCGNMVHYNYSSRNINSEESFQGVKG